MSVKNAPLNTMFLIKNGQNLGLIDTLMMKKHELILVNITQRTKKNLRNIDVNLKRSTPNIIKNILERESAASFKEKSRANFAFTRLKYKLKGFTRMNNQTNIEVFC